MIQQLKYLTIPNNTPFSIDIIDPIIKIKVLELLKKHNLLSRTIYNSIHIGITDNEYNALKKNTPNSAIIVAFNPKDKSPDGKIEVLENSANLKNEGLLEIVKKLGIKNILLHQFQFLKKNTDYLQDALFIMQLKNQIG